MLQFWDRYRRNRTSVAGLLIVSAVIAMAGSASLLFPGDPLGIVGAAYIAPFETMEFPLGTDPLGRDILAGLFYGARISLLVGLVASLGATVIGTAIGAVAGFHGGRLGSILMRITEMFQTTPNIMLALVLVTILGPSIASVVCSISLVTWPAIARLTRAEFLKLRNQDFVLACVAMGMRSGRIIMTQVLPNALPPIVVMASIIAATAILVESALSFLGLGDPNVVSWGMMIGTGRSVLRSAPYVALFPGLIILFTVLGINLVGEGLNEVLNPRLRDR
ncbi:ABC transporter permease [Bradyrhizobium sp. Arg237L]|uniref:ABC transporter permease n=1 Tax=Bradyrhizobium sp. Arg237L TaxID=3003352 RepID=UPI00249DE58E|nr:ABC transporter permease [Bradyrhizobium sp. Arg237L]MDI4234127.1 ABC transporter permease [Bradyrhizobium sp. Arg237L]